jgi:IrrE N-terminal-like domain
VRLGTTSARRLTRLVSRARGRAATVDAVADGLGIVVSERALSAVVLGATVSSDRIVIGRDLNPAVRRFVLAHEIGHALVARGETPWVEPVAEEDFCDGFAIELLRQLSCAPVAESGVPAGTGPPLRLGWNT